MTHDTKIPLDLSGAQKRTLRARGHHLNPVIQIGKEGISENLINSTTAALKSHELVKVKIGQNVPVERGEAAMELARLTASALVQQIGKVFLLYRPNPDLPADKRIALS
ncbi:MAG: ribosome assembly RNA-binding protein YhbY [Desulfobulbaceae bacterium]|nr:ribosome assembly RNA-binding protein YhbY [Desulfobulbaceae bacterium]